jgi:hypothetical protein
MSAETRHDRLQSLMAEALETCQLLQVFSDDNFQVFFSDDDDKILDVIARREEIIEKLLGIENNVDLLLEEAGEYKNGRALPEDIEEIRRSVRQVLNDVSARDIEIMKIISSKMHVYKTETLKARNKKNISAYMKASFGSQPGDSVDFTK